MAKNITKTNENHTSRTLRQWKSPLVENFSEIRSRSSNASGHHCSVKPTHSFSNRCIKHQHGGWCPECNHLVPWKYGCKTHGFKKKELLNRPLETTNDEPDAAGKEVNERAEIKESNEAEAVAEKSKLKCWRNAVVKLQKIKKR